VRRQVERLYTGPQTDSELVEHMKACNAKGPLVVHIAKLFPKSDCSAFDAFGRVFSGTVRPGDKARCMVLKSIWHGVTGRTCVGRAESRCVQVEIDRSPLCIC